jgi:transcriptional regulator with XRE-family HTH domain
LKHRFAIGHLVSEQRHHDHSVFQRNDHGQRVALQIRSVHLPPVLGLGLARGCPRERVPEVVEDDSPLAHSPARVRHGPRVRAVVEHAGRDAKVGVAVETISRLERGSSIPSLERLREVADALGVQLRDLLDFREGKTGRDEAIDALVRELERREQADAVLVHDLAKRVFAEFRARRGRAEAR